MFSELLPQIHRLLIFDGRIIATDSQIIKNGKDCRYVCAVNPHSRENMVATIRNIPAASSRIAALEFGFN
jgi:hypothetical protein